MICAETFCDFVDLFPAMALWQFLLKKNHQPIVWCVFVFVFIVATFLWNRCWYSGRKVSILPRPRLPPGELA